MKFFWTRAVEKIKTRILCSVIFCFENRAVYEIIRKKYGNAIQATDDIKIRRMRLACWKTKAVDTLSELVIPIAFFRGKTGFANAPYYYVTLHYLYLYSCKKELQIILPW